MCDIKIISLYYFPNCMIKHCISVEQDSMRWLKDQTFVCDVKCCMKMFDLDQMSDPDVSLWRYAKVAKKDGQEKTDFVSHFCPSHVPLRFVTSQSRFTPVSHSPLCEKRSI